MQRYLFRITYDLVRIGINESGSKIDQYIHDKHEINPKIEDQKWCHFEQFWRVAFILKRDQKGHRVRNLNCCEDHEGQNQPIPYSFEKRIMP